MKILGCDVPPDWAIVTVRRDGQLAGFFCLKDNEIHCHRAEDFTGRWLTRQDLERLTAPLFKRHGFIKTKVRNNNETGHAFVSRLGFTESRKDGQFTYYETKRLKHARL